ncbi:MAG TPA: DinB family protein [Candidatus Limnocylindrales bacterium]
MTDAPTPSTADLRASVIDGLLAARAAEVDILAALDPAVRDAPAPDGGWSPKDIQAHLSAWRDHQADRFEAIRLGHPEPSLPATETDEANAVLHAQRADWTWEAVAADADVVTARLIAEVRQASDEVIADGKLIGTTMGNGPEHDLGHLPALAALAGLDHRVVELAARVEAAVRDGGWPPRARAFARYNLACYHALEGRFDEARALLREALPVEAELRELAPHDDDLVALRSELPDLIAG